MDLENQVRSRRNKLRHAVRPAVRRTAGRIHQQQVAGGPVRLQPVLRIAESRSGKGLADRRVPQPLRIRRPNIDHRVMHVLRAGRTNFRHLHPLVFGEMRGHDLVGVFHVAIGRDLDRLRHLQNHIRARDIPALSPLPRRQAHRADRPPERRLSPMPASWRFAVRVSEGSLAKCPNRGSANHGGIILLCTALAIAGAHGRVCS